MSDKAKETKERYLPGVTYHCTLCGEPFETEQGSRRKYCPKCIVERVTAKKPRRK